ncbi:MAG: hypothetical protein KDE54_25330, partial [Caldilineaceae bacterium]|nr:hypothetical protein [Caldilineaceae bacterium]
MKELIRSKVWLSLLALLAILSLWDWPPASVLAANPIVEENQQPGSSDWVLLKPANDVDMQIKGYASATSVNLGGAITFYVSVSPAQNFTVEIYRMGWYDGAGGRLMQQIGPLNGAKQPAVTLDAATGLITAPWS